MSFKKLVILFYFLLSIFTCSINATQYEEGWRWRRSLIDLNNLMNGDSIHNTLSEYEHGLSLKLIEETNKNIDLAAIGLVYEVKKPQLPVQFGYEWDVVRFVSYDANNGLPCAFVSGYHTRHDGNSFRDKQPTQISGGETFFIINGDTFKGGEWRENVESYFNTEDASSLKIIGKDVTQYILNQIADEENFTQSFSHAEQWILQYLNSYDINDGSYVFNAQMEKILKKIIEKERVGKDDIQITRVVLHVHTNRDACIRCASTMSIFSKNLHTLLNTWLYYTMGKWSLRMPLILVSSRTNYQERRFLAGHDRHYDDHFNLKIQENVSAYYKAFVNWPSNYANNTLK